MSTKSFAIRLATGLAGSVALFGVVAAPAFAYYSYNSSAYCSDRYNPNCMEQVWGPGYFQPYNTNYNSWYMNSSNYPYYDRAYGYPANSYPCMYNCGYSTYNYPSSYSYSYPMMNYSMPNYNYQYQYQYQYSY